MKKTILTLTAFLAFSFQTKMFAQKNRFDIAFITGPNYIWLVGNKIIEDFYRPTIRYSSGLNLNYHFHKRFSLMSGLLYERKGAASNIIVTDVTGHQTGTARLSNNFDYLIVPLAARVAFGKKFKMFLGAGGYGAYLLKATNELSSDILPQSKTRIDSVFKKFDFGFLLNFGVSVPIFERISISLEARDNIGYYNIATPSVFQNQPVKTRSLNVLLGITWAVSKRKV